MPCGESRGMARITPTRPQARRKLCLAARPRILLLAALALVTSVLPLPRWGRDWVTQLRRKQLREIRVRLGSPCEFKDYPGVTKPCTFGGQELLCRYGFDIPLEEADAVWFDAMAFWNTKLLPPKAFPGQQHIIFTMEPHYKLKMEHDPDFLQHFDLVMDFHLDSDVPLIYPPFDVRKGKLAIEPPLEERKAAVAYINSNCYTPSGRDSLVEELMTVHKVPVDALGECLHNFNESELGGGKDSHWGGGNRALYSKYRVCVAIENSKERDYVTEKVWHVLGAGCVPLYMGAPNAREDFLPHNDSVIHVEDYASVGDLAKEIKRVLADKAAWEKYTAWRALPFDSLGAGYRALLRRNELPHTRCQMCQLLAEKKLARRPRLEIF